MPVAGSRAIAVGLTAFVMEMGRAWCRGILHGPDKGRALNIPREESGSILGKSHQASFVAVTMQKGDQHGVKLQPGEQAGDVRGVRVRARDSRLSRTPRLTRVSIA